MKNFPLVASLLALAIAGCETTQHHSTGQSAAKMEARSTYNVRDFGAVGDGATKDTVAFQKALDACAVAGGGDVLVPAGNYLIGSVQIGYGTVLRLMETNSVIIGSGDASDYPSMDIRWEGRWQPGRRALIYAANVDHTGIIGPGRIEGNRAMAAPQNPRGAVVLEPISCNDVRWEGFTVTQGGNWATHPTYCSGVVIKNIRITGDRDGIDIDSCKDVRIEGCDLNTGDDCISLKSGRGLNGARVGKPAEDILISGCTMRGRRFAGVGIGSETSGGVRNVRIEHCKMDCRTFGIYIKTRVGRAGVIENILGDDLDILGGGFLKINLVSAGNLNTSDDPVEGDAGIPLGRNYSFSNIRVTNCSRLVDARDISPKKPLEGFSLVNVSGTCTNAIALSNVIDPKLKNIHVSGYQGELVVKTNAIVIKTRGAVSGVEQ
jgi:polygalacturonase